MSQSRTLSGGLEVQTDASAVASGAQDQEAHLSSSGTLGTRHAASAPRTRKLPSKATRLVLVYEAGPWGYGRYRYLCTTGSACGVVAPALLPPRPGDRGHTDRRAARP